jgi:predicted  nucleic acid-binding Zn-ribbon protein
MKDGLLDLLKLQDIDKKLQDLEDRRDRYPEEITTRQRDIDQARTAVEDQERGIEDNGREQRKHERELTAAKASLKEHEARFSSVSTNREYDALQQEIEADKARMADLEGHILTAMEGAQALAQELVARRQAYDETRAAQQPRIDALEADLATLQQQVDGVVADRERVLSSVDPALLRMYERSRKRRGTRVAPIRKGACGVCFRQLPAQQRNNVRYTAQVYLCESCGAILIWDDQSS